MRAVPAWLRAALRAPVILYEHDLGSLLGYRFLLLTHTGRRTGATYRTVLEVVRYEPATGEAIVVSGLGPRSDWFRNLRAGGPADVTIRRARHRVSHRVLSPTDAAEVLVAYENHHRWTRPVIRAALSRLVGWRYDGSPGAAKCLAEQLPIVALTPILAPATEEQASSGRDDRGGGIPEVEQEHRRHEQHDHVHEQQCGQEAVQHGDHVDYVHDGHRHPEHNGHYDEH